MGNLKRKPVHRLAQGLTTDPGFYGIFIPDLDRFIYIGYASNIQRACQDWISKTEQGSTRALCDFLRQVRFEFSKLPFKDVLPEQDRHILHLKIITTYKTKLTGDEKGGLNIIDPTTGKKFR